MNYIIVFSLLSFVAHSKRYTTFKFIRSTPTEGARLSPAQCQNSQAQGIQDSRGPLANLVLLIYKNFEPECISFTEMLYRNSLSRKRILGPSHLQLLVMKPKR